MKIAVCQMEIIFENKIANLNKICKFISEAKQKGADVIFFPEMTLSGFSMNIEKVSERDSYCLDKIKKFSKQNNIFTGLGWVKPLNDKAENHYSIISSEGGFLSDYVKIHPFSYSDEDKFFTGGNKISIFNINNINFSSFICYDLRFPEIFRIVSEMVSVIVVAANWPLNRIDHWKSLLKARAIENQCYIIGINCFGIQKDIVYNGMSCIFNPNGDMIFCIQNKEYLYTFDFEDDTENYRKSFPFLNDRKVYLYKDLL